MASDQIVAPELAVYEVVNAVWKHEYVLKDLKNGAAYLSILYGLIEAKRILVVTPNEQVMLEAYAIAGRNHVAIYDAVFVALAVNLGLALKSYDKAQIRLLKSEKTKP